jgi:hypothetical protein
MFLGSQNDALNPALLKVGKLPEFDFFGKIFRLKS